MIATEVQAGKRLVDRSGSGHVRPWDIHKSMNGLLALAYLDVDERKTERLRNCASFLGFIPTENGGMRLSTANFCRVRLCPLCTWRRSLKLQAQVHEIMSAMEKDGNQYAFAYLTLTVKNMTGDKLSKALDEMNIGFNKLTKAKEFQGAVKGFFKSMEITHNVDTTSKDYDTYHPHIHVLLAVNPSYFKGKNYIKQDRWTELWQRAMRLNYTPNVDIRKVKGNTSKAVAEAAGYGTKSSSFIIPDDWDLTVETVRLLDTVLANRRFVGFGGVMRDYHRKMKLDDAEDGDLVHISGDEPTDADRSKEVFYAWHTGYRQYRQAGV